LKALDDAAKLDAEDRPLEAAQAYELAIRQGSAPIEAYINLACIYLNLRDFGYASYHRIPLETQEAASDRFQRVLTEAEARFGKYPELEFWRRYFSFFAFGEEPFYEEAANLAGQGVSVAYLHLAGQGHYQRETRALLESVKLGRTTKERFIASVLKSRALSDWLTANA
jgi:hypothetical protein